MKDEKTTEDESSGDVAHADDERISAHIERHFGPESTVWHELVSTGVHIDVHMTSPSEEHPYVTLVTSGMSALPMNLPEGVEDPDQWRYAELMMLLPPDWDVSHEAFEDERNYWPLRLLKRLARMPSKLNTWFGWGHSIANGQPPAPYAPGLPFTGALLIKPYGLPDVFKLEGDPTLTFFQVLPVTDAEMALKFKVGLDDLLDAIEEVYPEIYGPLNIHRPTVG